MTFLLGLPNYVLGRKAEQDERGKRMVVRVIPHHLKIGFDVFAYGIIKRRVREGGSEADPEWRIGHPIVFPNILRVGWTVQIRVPMDDTHTWHLMYQALPVPPGAEPTQTNIPVYEIPITDERGRHITDFVLGQDMAAWVTQGPIARREPEKLGESDRGIILYRRLLQEQLDVVERGGDPMSVFHDPEQNTILQLPVEWDLVETARARRLSSGQAPYSRLQEEVEEAWARAPEIPAP